MRYTRSPVTPMIIPAAKATRTTTTAEVRVLFTAEGHPIDGDLRRIGGDLIDRRIVRGALDPGEAQGCCKRNRSDYGGKGAQPSGEQLRDRWLSPHPRANACRDADNRHLVHRELQLAGVVAKALEEAVVGHLAAS